MWFFTAFHSIPRVLRVPWNIFCITCDRAKRYLPLVTFKNWYCKPEVTGSSAIIGYTIYFFSQIQNWTTQITLPVNFFSVILLQSGYNVLEVTKTFQKPELLIFSLAIIEMFLFLYICTCYKVSEKWLQIKYQEDSRTAVFQTNRFFWKLRTKNCMLHQKSSMFLKQFSHFAILLLWKYLFIEELYAVICKLSKKGVNYTSGNS